MKLRICLLISLTLLALLYQAAAQVSFTLASSPVVGLNPSSVVAMDVYGNGKLDLIVLSAGYNGLGGPVFGTLTVLTNSGCGMFGSNATYTMPNVPWTVVAADVNGDGKPDLICADGRNSALSVLTNNGSGIFGSNATYTVGYGSYWVEAADVNGDGKVDLISANGGGTTITVLTNNGSGIFGSNATYAVGYMPQSVVAVDVNGDGKVDLICAFSGNPFGVTVLTNNGIGIFGSNATYTICGRPDLVMAADVNVDGKPDLISVNRDDNTLTVLTNNGIGVFGSNATYTVGDNCQSVVAADVNGDGKLDLICANFGENGLGGNITVLTNDGSGGFVFASTLNVGMTVQAVMAADINGDGKEDLISANLSGYSGTLSVLINNTAFPPPTFPPPVAIHFQSQGMLLVSWPSASAGWSLQQNPDLTTANWGPSGYSGYGISDDGTNKSLTILPTSGNLFFRILHP
ncbi:MAG: VCBS repeat-containing protein [Verrucomicrobiota bacterium]|jgi:hypothetical protein